jgi:AcrR family transcriptional regulator
MTKRLKAEERRKQILKCAVKVFARSNYKTTRVADIAKEVGISEAAIYKYFPKKEDIFLEILEHISKRVIIVWGEQFVPRENALKIIKTMGVAYYKRMIKHPDELKLQFQAISEIGNPRIAKRLKADHEYYLNYFKKVLHHGMQEGTIRKDIDIDTVAWILNGIGILLNMAQLLKFKKEFNETTIKSIAEHLARWIKV